MDCIPLIMYWAWYGWSCLLVWLDGQRHRRISSFPIYQGVVRLVLLALVLVLLSGQKVTHSLNRQACIKGKEGENNAAYQGICGRSMATSAPAH